MGRSVSRPHNAVAVAFRTLTAEPWEDEEGKTHEPDAEDYRFEFDHIVEWVRDASRDMWGSFVLCDKWIDCEDHVLLQNDLAYIGISEYCGMVSIWLVPRTDDYYGYDDKHVNFCVPWCNQIADKFLKTFSEYTSIARASNGEEFFERVER